MLHVHALRQREWARDIPIIVIIEGNLSKVVARTIANVIEGCTNLAFRPIECLHTQMKANEAVEPFVWVDGYDAKQRFHMWLNRMFTNEQIYLSSDYVVAPRDNARVCKETFATQLRNVRIVSRVQGSGAFETISRSISGKGSGQQDDLAMALMFGAFWGGMHEMQIAVRDARDLTRFENRDLISAHTHFVQRVWTAEMRRGLRRA